MAGRWRGFEPLLIFGKLSEVETAAGLVSRALSRSGVTARQLASSAGLSEGRLSDYIHGRHSPGTDQLIRIASAAGLQLELVPNFDSNGVLLADLLDLGGALTAGGKSRWPPVPPRFGELVGALDG